MSIMQEIYNAEFNIEVKSVFDLGFEVRLGDGYNGYKEHKQVTTWAEVERILVVAIIYHYPKSDFAQKHKVKIPNMGDRN